MEITLSEIQLFDKYINTKDKSIIQRIIDYPWAYSAQMVEAAIAIQCGMFPVRMACDNLL